MFSACFVLLVAAYLVSLFFHWTTPSGDGFAPDSTPGLETFAYLSFPVGLGLVLWEFLGASGVRRTKAADALVSFFLAAIAAAICLAAVVNIRVDGRFVSDVDLTAWAWVSLALAGLILVAGVVRLREHISGSRMPP